MKILLAELLEAWLALTRKENPTSGLLSMLRSDWLNYFVSFVPAGSGVVQGRMFQNPSRDFKLCQVFLQIPDVCPTHTVTS